MEIQFNGEIYDSGDVIETLGPYLTDERRGKIYATAKKRTFNFIPILEKIFDQGNINAVFRSAESMGFQRVHVIENEKIKISSRVTKGADKWLDITRWQNTKDCVENLKSQGYKILVTHLSEKAQPIGSWDFSQKTAMIFGSEGFGVSEEAVRLADKEIIIPMHGFTQSYNISVAAAISMYHIEQQRTKKLGQNGDLHAIDIEKLVAKYYLNSCNKGMEAIAKKLIKEKS